MGRARIRRLRNGEVCSIASANRPPNHRGPLWETGLTQCIWGSLDRIFFRESGAGTRFAARTLTPHRRAADSNCSDREPVLNLFSCTTRTDKRTGDDSPSRCTAEDYQSFELVANAKWARSAHELSCSLIMRRVASYNRAIRRHRRSCARCRPCHISPARGAWTGALVQARQRA